MNVLGKTIVLTVILFVLSSTVPIAQAKPIGFSKLLLFAIECRDGGGLFAEGTDDWYFCVHSDGSVTACHGDSCTEYPPPPDPAGLHRPGPLLMVDPSTLIYAYGQKILGELNDLKSQVEALRLLLEGPPPCDLC
jgi:hypothetical protein